MTLIGVDESGTGAWAGPFVVCACAFVSPAPLGLKDSKKLSAANRTRLAHAIRQQALAWAVAQASVEEIEHLNILHASLLAMQRAVLALSPAPELALIDGNRCPLLVMPARAVVRGDSLVPAISAASILAKTERDKEMARLADIYPEYGFARHAGYPTPEHLEALERYGACPEHRRSYGPVRRILEKNA